ncbi:MAG: helix-turn-helix domain-containing protein [Opitutaceae bacterium]|nr:helix-turn-helix domain-containing protein [Opitutaceae bacterium]
MSRKPTILTVTADQRGVLERWVGAHGTPQQVVKRCRIILRKAEGLDDATIAEELEVNRHTCRLWRQRLCPQVQGLWDVANGRGRKPRRGLAKGSSKRRCTRSRRGGRTGAREPRRRRRACASTVARIWQEHGLQPHRQGDVQTLPRSTVCAQTA